MAKRYHLLWPEIWGRLLKQAFEDDGTVWDWTSIAIRGEARAKIIAKSEGIWAAETLLDSLSAISAEIGAPVEADSKLKDGDRFKPGAVLSEWKGDARSVLALERPVLNLAAYVSGIATRTARLMKVIREACPERTPRLTPTRKTLPGYRDVAILGVRAGGGHSHRVSLSGGVLIKENHISSAGGIAPAIAAARREAPHGLKVEIEVTSQDELVRALEAGAEVVLLDHFSPEQVHDALVAVDRSAARNGFRAVVEVSGNLNEGNIAPYAMPGVDLFSVGSLTHSVTSSDFSLLVERGRSLAKVKAANRKKGRRK